MKRPRPHVPLKVRAIVALGQIGMGAAAISYRRDGETAANYLRRILGWLAKKLDCLPGDLRLDHNPALILREFNKRTGKYKPDANDPGFLIYRTAHAHHIKTNVKGDGAQRSDTAARVHQRRLDQNRGVRKRRPKAKIKSRSSWPIGRKIQSRGFNKSPRAAGG